MEILDCMGGGSIDPNAIFIKVSISNNLVINSCQIEGGPQFLNVTDISRSSLATITLINNTVNGAININSYAKIVSIGNYFAPSRTVIASIGGYNSGGGGNNNPVKLGTSHNLRAGQRIETTSSKLYNRILEGVSVSLNAIGAPSGNITCNIRKADDTIAVRFGTPYNVNQLSMAFTTISCLNTANTYALKNGDKIVVEYSGGDANNYVEMDTNTTKPFEGANSDLVAYVSSYTATSTSDAAMTLANSAQVRHLGKIILFRFFTEN
jgi:hypothetical protein